MFNILSHACIQEFDLDLFEIYDIGNSSASDGDIRLVGGSSYWEERVEIYHKLYIL